ncbi:hypothetical protein RE6C_04492 [Rhodopirellula europaea 6C]|uniref:Uncharacterized protein n=1 Tax=Rhodopirellula europaea 6C TaxID=1263867 RepID=M2ACN2_9BACT|nr:hypothetical protein RE6C_04492 [Rhodopirellula europaea 6C]
MGGSPAQWLVIVREREFACVLRGVCVPFPGGRTFSAVKARPSDRTMVFQDRRK